MEHTTRRQFINRSSRAAGGIALLGASSRFLLACGSDEDDSAATAATAGAAPPATVRSAFSWIPDVEWASWYMAESQGFFTANAIESTLLHGGPNTPAVSQVIAGGGAEIGLAADELELINGFL